MWQDLLSEENETIIAPWIGGYSVYYKNRTFKIINDFPKEFGWYKFKIISSRKISVIEKSEPSFSWDEPYSKITGYLIGNVLIKDDANYQFEASDIIKYGTRIYLIEPGIEKFSRVSACLYEDKQYIFCREEFPVGPENFVLEAFEDKKESIDDLSDIIPSLDLCFRYEVWRRKDIEAKRLADKRRRDEEEAIRLEEERRKKLIRKIGTGSGRRELAKVDFSSACKAALEQAGAEYLSHRILKNQNEIAVRYRFRNNRLECVINKDTLRVVDSGICLTSGGISGDTFFTLESLPAVVDQAINEDRLVVYRRF